jgi:5'-nucleotidase
MEESRKLPRRSFLKAGLPILGMAFLPDSLFGQSAKRERRLSILHTNDWHSRIDPFPVNDPKFPGMGGAARRSALINSIREEAGDVLLLDAGDIVQGTPYFNYYAGVPEIQLMNEMGYECATLGNHDFDNGIEGLKKLLRLAKFPFVNCNYDFGTTGLKEFVHKSVVIKKSGLRIGIVGVGIDLKPLLPAENIIGIQYNHPIEIADIEAQRLKKSEKCDLVICLSHLGYEYQDGKVSDRVLASQTRHIDLIIGGHTHTFLEKPVQVANLEGRMVTINQVGWAGLRLGRINYHFSSINNTKNGSTSQIEVFKKSIAI